MLATLLQLLGVVAVTVGAGLIALPAGFVVGGLMLMTVGLAMERGSSDAQ